MGRGFGKYLQGLDYFFAPKPTSLHVLGNAAIIMTTKKGIQIYETYDILIPSFQKDNPFTPWTLHLEKKLMNPITQW
jgi:hypothetical protein